MFSKSEITKWIIPLGLRIIATLILLVMIAVTGLILVAVNEYQNQPLVPVAQFE